MGERVGAPRPQSIRSLSRQMMADQLAGAAMCSLTRAELLRNVREIERRYGEAVKG